MTKKMSLIGSIIFIVFSLTPTIQAGSGNDGQWQWLNPYPVGNHLTSVSISPSGEVILAGEAGMIINYTGEGFSSANSPTLEDINDMDTIDGAGIIAGNHSAVLMKDDEGWFSNPPPSTSWFYGASILPDGTMWVCGDLGNIYYFDGEQWNSQPSGTSTTFKDIEMIDESCGFAVGLFGTVRKWDGTSWQYVTSTTSRFLRKISGYDCNRAWAVGDLGTIIIWNGSGFQVETSPVSLNLYSVLAVNEDEAWAVGDSGTVLHRILGEWQQLDLPELQNTDLRSITQNPVNGEFWITGKHGMIAIFDGFDCTRMDFDRSSNRILFDISINPVSDKITIAGSDGQIWEYDEPEFIPEIDGYSVDFNRLFQEPSGVTWAGGNEGVLLKDSGSGWIPVNTGNTDDIHDIDIISPESIWTAGGHSDGTCVSWTVLHFDGENWVTYSESGS